MSVFPPEIVETLSVSSDILLIGLSGALIYAYYRFLPKVGRKIGQDLAVNFLRGLMQILKSQKFSELGQKGVAARQFEAVMSEEQGLVVPLVGEALKSWVKERFGSKAEAKIAAAIDMVPFNADPVIFANLPQIAERLGGMVGKGVEAKALAEELKMLTKVKEPVK